MRGKMKRKINQQTNKKIRSSSFQKYPVALEASDKPVKAKAWVRIAYIHACACARVCTYVCTCMHIYIVCSFIQIYVVAYTDIGLLHTYTCMYVWMDVRAYVCMYGYVRNCDSMCNCTCMYNVCVLSFSIGLFMERDGKRHVRIPTCTYLPTRDIPF